MKEIGIGLIGCGNVGTGVVKWLRENAALIEARCGVLLSIRKIAVNNIGKDRGIKLESDLLTTDAVSVVNDPDVDIIVELIGGTTAAKDIVELALEKRKPVVTANKSLLAFYGSELFSLASAQDTDIYYEASVAGGISIIKAIKEGLTANNIQHIYGILNGTCNFILTRMERDGADFNDVLKDAQRLGFAEADPALDIDGDDTAHKTCILASLAYGEWFDVNTIHVEGIRNLELQDIRNAADAGYTIKLLGIVKLESGNIQMRVHPVLIPSTSLLAKVSDEFNAVWVKGDAVGDSMFLWQGSRTGSDYKRCYRGYN